MDTQTTPRPIASVISLSVMLAVSSTTRVEIRS
jgi:hypothetical protein